MFRKKLTKLPTGDLEMQIVDWSAYDVMYDLNNDSDDENEYKKKNIERKYQIRIYGLNAEGQ